MEMDNLDYIDDYFKNQPADEQKQQFEQRIVSDDSFAEEVAFYLSANNAIKDQLQQEKKERFREIYQKQKEVPIKKQSVKIMWRYAAAASVAALIFISSMLLFNKHAAPDKLASNYIKENLQTLSVTMGTNADSLQNGLNLLNTGKLREGVQLFESMLQHDAANTEAIKYAGIACLRVDNYDKALYYFKQLAANTGLYSNPGKFYQALTLLKRNKNGDKAAAKQLLQEVKENKLEGVQTASEWLEKL
jgi:hypothetical protein